MSLAAEQSPILNEIMESSDGKMLYLPGLKNFSEFVCACVYVLRYLGA